MSTTLEKQKGKAYIIEHMEADENTPESLPPWVMLEYSHILERTFRSDRENRVFFTNLSPKSGTILSSQLSASASATSSSSAASSAQRATAQPLSESVEALIAAGRLPPKPRICLLDPKAEKAICPEDAEEFDAFLFGGILGDDPPRDRTKELRKLGFPGRHLDKVQMTTDTAVYVTSLVVDDGRHLDKLSYVDYPTIQFNDKESVEMPFRYVKDAESGQPTMPKGMKELLYEDMNKGFEDFEQ